MGVGWVKEEERETKRKLSVRKEPWTLTAETEHLMADRGSSYLQAPGQHQPSRAKLEGRGKHVVSQAHKGREREGREMGKVL